MRGPGEPWLGLLLLLLTHNISELGRAQGRGTMGRCKSARAQSRLVVQSDTEVVSRSVHAADKSDQLSASPSDRCYGDARRDESGLIACPWEESRSRER